MEDHMNNEPITPEQANQPAPTEPVTPVEKPKKTVSVSVFVVSLILVLLLGALGGYAIGSKLKEDELTQKYTTQINELSENADKAKTTVSDNADQNQQTIDALEAENAAQKTTIDQLNQKIAELEKELEAEDTPTTN